MRRFPIIQRAAAVFAVVLLYGCSGDKEQQESHGAAEGVAARRFASWDDFRASPQGAQASPHQVVFVGIDGGVWWYVDQLIDQGKLPNIARIKREGTFADLRSVPSQVSPPAWCSMMSGFLPEKTGIYTFGNWVPETEQFLSVRSDDSEVPMIWDVASHAGRKVAVVNVPLTYPVSSVNGIMVSGLLTPIDVVSSINTEIAPSQPKSEYVVDRNIKSFSPVRGTALQDSLNLFLFLMYDTTDDGVSNYDAITARIVDKTETDPAKKELDRLRFGANEYSRWVSIKYKIDGEIKSAYTKLLWVEDGKETLIKFATTVFPIEAQFTYPPELKDKLNEHFGFYLPTKFLGAEILPRVTRETAEYARFFYDYDDWDFFAFVFTQTDNIHHLVGFTDLAAQVYEEIDKFIGDMMERMPANSTLIIGSDHGFNEYKYGVDMNHFLAKINLLEWKSKNKIDYARTLVFHNLYFLYFNYDLISREELARRGIEVPDGVDPVDFLVRYISEAGHALKTPERDFPLEFVRLPRGTAGEPPEMMVRGTYTDYGVQFWNIMKPHSNVFWELKGSERFWHERDGILMVWGEGVREGYDAGVKPIEDVAPTMQYLLGLPLAPDTDGSIMFDALLPNLAHNTRYVVTDYRDIPREVASDTEERESLQKKLRALGYIQ